MRLLLAFLLAAGPAPCAELSSLRRAAAEPARAPAVFDGAPARPISSVSTESETLRAGGGKVQPPRASEIRILARDGRRTPSPRPSAGPAGGFFDWLSGLFKLLVLGPLQLVKNLVMAPVHMARDLKAGKSEAWLYPLLAPLDAAWSAVTLAAAAANQAVAPAYGLVDKEQGVADVGYCDGLLWTSGGPAGGVLSALDRPRFRYFMPSQVVVFGDKAQIDSDRNPANPDDPYDTNAVNARHEVILRDRRPVGYFTHFAVPWFLNPGFRHREESSALEEAIGELRP